jgi:hypothetical protein
VFELKEVDNFNIYNLASSRDKVEMFTSIILREGGQKKKQNGGGFL